MSFSKIALFLLITLTGCVLGTKSHADAAMERAAKTLSKTYDNGDSFTVTCHGAQNQKCTIKAKIDRIQKTFIVDFGEKGYVPTLDFIRVIGSSSKPWAFGAAVSVECDGRDELVLPEKIPSATCYTYLVFNGRGEVTWQEFMVVGQLMPKALTSQGP